MIVWCEVCKEAPLDTACCERLVCMDCGVQQDFDSYYAYREYNERLDETGPLDKALKLINQLCARLPWELILNGPDTEDHIIRSEN